jgi:RHH-type proline utilization regulon transcriptional repressor/proline dehydrogenase/delta 1-pyrroline-5-carboxylate dehydrogenase
MIDRTALRQAYRPDEEGIVRQRMGEAMLRAPQKGEATGIARTRRFGATRQRASTLSCRHMISVRTRALP